MSTPTAPQAAPADEPDLTAVYMAGKYDGRKEERALWELGRASEEIEAAPADKHIYLHALRLNRARRIAAAQRLLNECALGDNSESPLGRDIAMVAKAVLAAPAGQEAWKPDWKHAANVWADMAINGLQHLRNIVEFADSDESIDPKASLANMELCLARCRRVNDSVEGEERSSTKCRSCGAMTRISQR